MFSHWVISSSLPAADWLIRTHIEENTHAPTQRRPSSHLHTHIQTHPDDSRLLYCVYMQRQWGEKLYSLQGACTSHGKYDLYQISLFLLRDQVSFYCGLFLCCQQVRCVMCFLLRPFHSLTLLFFFMIPLLLPSFTSSSCALTELSSLPLGTWIWLCLQTRWMSQVLILLWGSPCLAGVSEWKPVTYSCKENYRSDHYLHTGPHSVWFSVSWSIRRLYGIWTVLLWHLISPVIIHYFWQTVQVFHEPLCVLCIETAVWALIQASIHVSVLGLSCIIAPAASVDSVQSWITLNIVHSQQWKLRWNSVNLRV